MEILLYVIILGLVLNMIANMIFKYLPKSNKRIDIWISVTLIIICILLLIYNKDNSYASNNRYQEIKKDTTQQARLYKVLSKIPDINPDQLINIIKEQQRINVKESCGEYDYQCFTNNDYKEFISNHIVDDIIVNLRRNNNFLETILAIKIMQPSKRQSLFETALKTYKPTWSKLGKVSCEGQTDAGQKAEKMIAKAIVDLAKELYQLSEEQIVQLMN